MAERSNQITVNCDLMDSDVSNQENTNISDERISDIINERMNKNSSNKKKWAVKKWNSFLTSASDIDNRDLHWFTDNHISIYIQS